MAAQTHTLGLDIGAYFIIHNMHSHMKSGCMEHMRNGGMIGEESREEDNHNEVVRSKAVIMEAVRHWRRGGREVAVGRWNGIVAVTDGGIHAEMEIRRN